MHLPSAARNLPKGGSAQQVAPGDIGSGRWAPLREGFPSGDVARRWIVPAAARLSAVPPTTGSGDDELLNRMLPRVSEQGEATQRALEALAALGSGAAGIVLAHLGFPDAGALLAAGGSPAGALALHKAAEQIRRRQWVRGSRLISRAAAKAQLQDDALVERLLATPHRAQLFTAAVEGSFRAVIEEKVEAFADALRTGALAEGDRTVDEETLFVRAMSDFEEPHIRLLVHLEGDPNHPGTLRSESLNALAGVLGTHALAGVLGTGNAVNSVVATLQRHGAIEQVQMDAEAIQRGSDPRRMRPAPGAWMLTGYGLDCLRRLRSAGAVIP
jgi:hypothetical protein